MRALARSKMTSPSKKRQTTETRNEAGEALASLFVAELEKIADGCATATEPRDDDSVRGYWLSKNWAQHLRRYYEQSRAELLSPSQKGTPVRRRSRRSSGEALPPWPSTLMLRFSASTASCVRERVRVLVANGYWSLERRLARHPGAVSSVDEVQGVDGRRVSASVCSCVESKHCGMSLLDGVAMPVPHRSAELARPSTLLTP